MSQTMTINGRRFRVIDERDFAWTGCQVKTIYDLRAASDGSEWRMEEIWSRPTMGPHRLVWRGKPERAE